MRIIIITLVVALTAACGKDGRQPDTKTQTEVTVIKTFCTDSEGEEEPCSEVSQHFGVCGTVITVGGESALQHDLLSGEVTLIENGVYSRPFPEGEECLFEVRNEDTYERN